MGDKDRPWVLACGCRFFGGNASICDAHRFDPRQARRDAARVAVWFIMACVVGLYLGGLLFGGCAVDNGGLGRGDDADTMGGKVRGADSGFGGMDSGSGDVDPVPDDAATVETDLGASHDVVDSTPHVDGGPTVEPNTCPKTPPISGCAPGPLAFANMVSVECCVPVDWEGYRVHCPEPLPGCGWHRGSFDGGWTGECCI